VVREDKNMLISWVAYSTIMTGAGFTWFLCWGDGLGSREDSHTLVRSPSSVRYGVSDHRRTAITTRENDMFSLPCMSSSYSFSGCAHLPEGRGA
jgi:hypothetical protein